MFDDLGWPINVTRRSVSISWASCLSYAYRHLLYRN